MKETISVARIAPEGEDACKDMLESLCFVFRQRFTSLAGNFVKHLCIFAICMYISAFAHPSYIYPRLVEPLHQDCSPASP